MEASKTDILQFIPKMEATRQNLVDELLYESRVQHDREHSKRDGTLLDEIISKLADAHTAIIALREEASLRR